MKLRTSWKILAIIIITIVLGFYDLPGETQQNIFSGTPESFTSSKINLGLDLQGGSQLDYKIDLRKVPEVDQANIIDGVRNIIERRVNGLGVSEPNIYISEVADEQHIIVELSETTTLTQDDVDQYLGIGNNLDDLTEDQKKSISLEKAKEVVGKTIQLEFKEEKALAENDEEERLLAEERVTAALARITEGEDFAIVGQEEVQAYAGKAEYNKVEFTFESELDSNLNEEILSLEVGQSSDSFIEVGGSFLIDESGQARAQTSLALVKLLSTSEAIKNEKEVGVSHILIAWEGLERSDATVTRTQDEALTLAQDIKKQLAESDGIEALFIQLAKDHSDDANGEDGGILPQAVNGDGSYVYAFEEASLAFQETDEISEIIETQFGYHIIKADTIRTDVKERQFEYETIKYNIASDPWQETGLTGEHFVHADFQLDQNFNTFVSIQFNKEGAKLFEDLTEKNVNKQIAIFVGGELISAPRVNEKITGGIAQITGNFTAEEAKALARDLNTGAIPAPIILTGEYTIGASLGKAALDKSLKAGGIGLLIVMVFMFLYYRLPGLIAALALTTYSAILIFLIKAQLHLGISLAISLLIFGFIIYKVTTNRDSGAEKLLSFFLACGAFLFITFILRTGVVITLAGIAGLILSIGMAVDANILIFERFKEELRKGKSYRTAIDTGFARAWTSIRDSNFSTLITCAILFYFGSSIIKGFAFNLAAGILVSMFSAITITRTLLQGFVGKKIAQNIKLFGVSQVVEEEKPPRFKFIKNSKLWLSLSAFLVIIAVVSTGVFGLKLGIDFTGGSLMEFKFEEQVNKATLVNTLDEIEIELNNSLAKAPVETESPSEAPKVSPPAEESNSPVLSEPQSAKVDLTTAQVIESGENGFIVKTKYLTSEVHDQVVDMMREKLPSFTEPRFTTIGPVIGKTLLLDAMKAIIIAFIMIILYVAFAFRKVSRDISKWKFGGCAIVALLHDVMIVTGLFVILGQVLNVEIDSLFITAMLTVLGYSVNDTIVVFDRLRENLLNAKPDEPIEVTADKALNETLARSINTSVSTLIALIAILVLGSASIFYFILALTVGAFIGTYSSIFLATPLLIAWKKSQDKNTPS